ncbi:lycopene cyclase domain-containing protein [bacterium]|nr:lycopene cyclase domain-containing protein [bacterium]
MNHFEYILFNLIVISGPVAFSFDRHVRFVRYWPAALCSALVLLAPFTIWDSLVTGRHWWFNPRYTSGTFIGPLPAGEWLFFITVPFASLFIWEVLRFYRPAQHAAGNTGAPWWIWLGLLLAGLVWLLGKEYTGLVILALTVTALADLTAGGRVLHRANALLYAEILTALMLLFNGYLTARPVVLYDAAYQLDLRIFTIPVEDFFYGSSLILGCTTVYEKIRSVRG